MPFKGKKVKKAGTTRHKKRNGVSLFYLFTFLPFYL